MEIDLTPLQSNLSIEKTLFSETGGFILSVGTPNKASLQELARNHSLSLFEIGKTTDQPRLTIKDILNEDIFELIDIWKKPLERLLGL